MSNNSLIGGGGNSLVLELMEQNKLLKEEIELLKGKVLTYDTLFVGNVTISQDGFFEYYIDTNNRYLFETVNSWIVANCAFSLASSQNAFYVTGNPGGTITGLNVRLWRFMSS